MLRGVSAQYNLAAHESDISESAVRSGRVARECLVVLKIAGDERARIESGVVSGALFRHRVAAKTRDRLFRGIKGTTTGGNHGGRGAPPYVRTRDGDGTGRRERGEVVARTLRNEIHPRR